MRLIPKSIVIRKLGGDRACWTAVVYILRGADWNAHDPEVPTADEEPPPANGVPHPMFGEGLTAEQLYQQQLQNWLLQNGIGNDQAPHLAPQHDGPQDAQWDPWPQPPVPQMPAALVNFKSWLATQGLRVQDGILPEDNVTDSLNLVWYETASSASTQGSALGSNSQISTLFVDPLEIQNIERIPNSHDYL